MTTSQYLVWVIWNWSLISWRKVSKLVMQRSWYRLNPPIYVWSVYTLMCVCQYHRVFLFVCVVFICTAVELMEAVKRVHALSDSSLSLANYSTMSYEFSLSARSCFQPGHAGQVFRCAFHPHRPIIACAVEGGRICVYERPKVAADGCPIPIGQWKEAILHPKTSYPALCLEWNVRVHVYYY